MAKRRWSVIYRDIGLTLAGGLSYRIYWLSQSGLTSATEPRE